MSENPSGVEAIQQRSWPSRDAVPAAPVPNSVSAPDEETIPQFTRRVMEDYMGKIRQARADREAAQAEAAQAPSPANNLRGMMLEQMMLGRNWPLFAQLRNTAEIAKAHNDMYREHMRQSADLAREQMALDRYFKTRELDTREREESRKILAGSKGVLLSNPAIQAMPPEMRERRLQNDIAMLKRLDQTLETPGRPGDVTASPTPIAAPEDEEYDPSEAAIYYPEAKNQASGLLKLLGVASSTPTWKDLEYAMSQIGDRQIRLGPSSLSILQELIKTHPERHVMALKTPVIPSPYPEMIDEIKRKGRAADLLAAFLRGTERKRAYLNSPESKQAATASQALAGFSAP